MLESLEHALKLENNVNNQLHLVHHKAELECKDSHVSFRSLAIVLCLGHIMHTSSIRFANPAFCFL